MAGKVNPAPEDNVGHPSSTKAQGRDTQKNPALPFEDLKEFRSQFEATKEEVRLQQCRWSDRPHQPRQITAERNKAQPLLKLGWATVVCGVQKISERLESSPIRR